MSVPAHSFHNRAAQEHHKRLWWTVYSSDRMWACLLGKPVSLPDEDIDADLPSTSGLSEYSLVQDFAGTDHSTASLRIASPGANEDFEGALEILQHLGRNGSFSGKEFYTHALAVRSVLEKCTAGRTISMSGDGQVLGFTADPPTQVAASSTGAFIDAVQSSAFTPSLEDLLSCSLDPQFLTLTSG